MGGADPGALPQAGMLTRFQRWIQRRRWLALYIGVHPCLSVAEKRSGGLVKEIATSVWPPRDDESEG